MSLENCPDDEGEVGEELMNDCIEPKYRIRFNGGRSFS